MASRSGMAMRLAIGLFAALLVQGCGGGGDEPAAGEPGATGATGAPQAAGGAGAGSGSGLVDPERVEACAGIDADAASEILGVPAADLTAFQGMEAETATMRSCGFRSQQNPGTAVGFYLQTLPSVQEAVARMEADRENLRMAAGAIGAVTGGEDRPPIEPIDGLGDEAYWTAVNGTLNIRQGNVIVQIVAPNDRQMQQRVAERIATGLAG